MLFAAFQELDIGAGEVDRGHLFRNRMRVAESDL